MRHSAKSFMRGRHLPANLRRPSPLASFNAFLKRKHIAEGGDPDRVPMLHATKGWRFA